MKTKTLLAQIAFLITLAPAASASFQFTEDFDDDTPGMDPTESWYSYSSNWAGNTVIAGSGPDGSNAFKITSVSGTQFHQSYFDSMGAWDLCDTTYTFEFDFRLIGTGSITGHGRTMLLQGTGLAGPDQGYGIGTPPTMAAFAGTTSGLDFGDQFTATGWQHIQVIPNCAAGSVEVYVDGAGPYTANAPGSSTDLDFIYLGTSKVSSGTNEFWFDNFVITADIPSPPQSLSGTITKTATASTSGIASLTWALSPDDPDQNTGDCQYDIYVGGVYASSDNLDAADGGGLRTYQYRFTGTPPLGTETFQIKAVSCPGFSGDSPLSDSITLDLDTLGSTDGFGAELVPQIFPTEFDQGLTDAVAGWGFKTAESQAFFVLILVGITTTGVASAGKWLSAGRGKNYVLLGSGILIGIGSIYLDFLDTWTFIVAFMLGLFAVRGLKDVRNTWSSTLRRIKKAQGEDEDEDVPESVTEVLDGME